MFDNFIEYEDLNEDTQMIWDVIGREATLELLRVLGGIRLYLVDYRRLERQARRRLARDLMRQGLSLDEIRRRTGLPISELRGL